MVCPHKWLPIGYRSSTGQGSSQGERPTFYRYSMQPICIVNGMAKDHDAYIYIELLNLFRVSAANTLHVLFIYFISIVLL